MATEIIIQEVSPTVVDITDPNNILVEVDGTQGPIGPANELSVGTVTSLNPDQAPDVTITGGSPSQTIDFDLPRASAVSVGTTSTSAPGGSAAVSNSGTDGDTVLDFTIPRGETGPTGAPGELTEAGANLIYVRLDGSTMTGTLTLDDDPTADLEAATKRYVDEVAQGLHSAPSARAATTANLDATYNNGTSGVGATLTATSNGAWEGVDGITVAEGYTWSLFQGVLVKDQSNTAHNGRYFISDLGSVSTPWVLTRCTFCDESSEIPGTFVFVEDGDTLKATGWVAIVNNPETFTVGTDAILFTQFSGAGTFIAGTGIDITGNTISVEADAVLPSQTGNDGKYLQTNGTIASWEVLDLDSKADKLLSTNAQTASYTLVLSDADKMVEMNVASANDLTVPLNSSVAYPVGTQINILQTGAGQTTIVATGGVTINATPGLKLRTQWSSVTLIKRATDTWVAIGDLTA